MHDDLLAELRRLFPIGVGIVALVVVAWVDQRRSLASLESAVVEALSDSEALSAWAIAERPPLDERDVYIDDVVKALERLCRQGRAVRWYTELETLEPGCWRRQAVYRRLCSVGSAPVPAPSREAHHPANGVYDARRR